MEDVAVPPSSQPQPPPPKKTSLSVDRAAFLLLRVKKAFKKKRQQRKEKQQTQLAGAAALASHSRSCRKVPPPLLRSRTLPAIIVPGIPVLSLHMDKNAFQLEEHLGATATKSGGSSRWSSLLLRNSPASTAAAPPAASTTSNVNATASSNNNNNNNMATIKSLNLPKDDATLVYRRKSSGSTPYSVAANNAAAAATTQQQQVAYVAAAADAALLQTCDDFECYADGSLLLRIPAPHVVAARAYRLAAKKRSSTAAASGATSSSAETRTAEARQSPTMQAASPVGGSGSGSGSGSSGGTNTALTRLAKLLHQSSTTTSKQTHLGGDNILTSSMIAPPNGGQEDAPRRLSWERRKDSSALQRSASIDSFAEIVWCDSPRPSLDIPRPVAPFSKRPSASSLFSNCSSTSATQSAQLNINYGSSGCGDNVGTGGGSGAGGGSTGNSRRESLLSPSSTRRNKLTRIINDNILPNSLTHDSATLRSVSIPTYDEDSLYECNESATVVLRNPPSTFHRTGSNNNNNYYYHHNHHSQHQNQEHSLNHAKRDNSHLNSAFRWSEQITQNVSVAKIRTAISCTAQDLKEMEFLLPHSNTTALPNNRATCESTNTSNSTGEKSSTCSPSLSSSSCSTSSGLSILRHSQAHVSSNHAKNMSNPKNAKLNGATQNDIAASSSTSDENNAGNAQNLAIHRQPASARAKGGNTPHRSKMTKKQLKLAQAQLDKLTQINLHLHALFSAVEHGHLDKARTILESTDIDVNSINSDGLSALDVAVLSNNRSMTKMLLQHGAIEASPQFATDSIGHKLNGLLKDAESRIYDLSGTADGPCSQPTFASRPSISSIIIGNTSSSVTGCTGNEVDKQIGIWERRVKGLRRLLLGWDQARPPDAPASVTVDVTGEHAIAVQILEPFEGAIATKFKVQWSTRMDFSNVVGEREIMDWSSFHGTMGAQCHVGGLTQGRRYFVRATCGNVKGWGAYKTSVPASIIPSSWRDLNNREDRFLGRQRVLDNLFTAVRLARPADVSELTLDTSNVQRRNPKKKTTIKQLFSVASKFQKNLRRGIYLASIIYCEDKVLVTSEDFLPVIEIDETYPSTLHSDYHWLMKVACTWDDVKSLRTDMERNLTSAVHFRTKLLSAICQMQSALGLNDLGQLYYKPLRDSHGTVVLTCVQAVKSQKTVSILNSRWLPVNKLQKKCVALLEDFNINEMLISSVGEQIHYHQASKQRLGPGLYLGYLKMQCSVEQIQVVVPAKSPNVLPHCKVRDNSHITAEEWQVLKRGSDNTAKDKREDSSLRLPLEFNTNSEATTEVQRLFLYDLTQATHTLFAHMNIQPEAAATHRLYDVEVIEYSKDGQISFLLICPSVESACAAPGQSELLLQRDDLASLSIQAFEMIHLRTYQPGIIQKYARLSCILELDTALANHSHREAFSTSELQTAKERLAKLQELTSSLNAVWKSVRWLMDVIAFARDKTAQPSLAMKEILDFSNDSRNAEPPGVSKQQLLQLPLRDVTPPKNVGTGRGSWPGPASGNMQSSSAATAAGGSNDCLVSSTEHSKSEQNLGRSSSVRTPTATASSLAPPPVLALSSQQQPTTQKQQQQQQQQLLKVSLTSSSNSEFGHFDGSSPRKNSGDSMTSQYTTRSYYSTAESGDGVSNHELDIQFAIPPSRSDDTLALASAEALKHCAASAASSHHRKRTSSNTTHTTTTTPNTPLITVHSSSSAPYLARDSGGSSLSLKCGSGGGGYSADYDTKPLKTEHPHTASLMSKVKAASSANLRDGGLYLKSTLSALQTEIKAAATAAADGPTPPQQSSASKSSSTKSLSRQSSEEDTASCSSLASEQAAAPSSSAVAANASGIIQVYTAYNTGLASGTSLKLHVTPKTSAREVINLVVKQLNMAAVLKGNNGPIYTSEMFDNFCLVAVIGARERCLRDDFKPLQLQNPWKKGRLYVRQKHELLAAIEHSNRKSHLI